MDPETIVYANDTNKCSPQELQALCTNIETLSKINQVEILRIFTNHVEMVINENKYGVHINMTDVPDNIIYEIESFLEYVRQQENDLHFIDSQQGTSENYMLQEHKEICPLITSNP
tara:strand:- start:631 stop:978 length:348 start_codon:yes stop_codon:yes gene_type:complete